MFSYYFGDTQSEFVSWPRVASLYFILGGDGLNQYHVNKSSKAFVDICHSIAMVGCN